MNGSRSAIEPIWTPSRNVCRHAQIALYMDWLDREHGLRFQGYNALWRWSIDELDRFWRSIWDYFDIQSDSSVRCVLKNDAMPGAQWFPDTRLNYTAQAFKHETDSRPAIVYRGESGDLAELTWAELRHLVAALADQLTQLDVGPGDRVVGYLPNIPEAVISFLAVASIGGVWSVCAPELGENAVLDRFRQIEPKVIIAVDGYQYAGEHYDRSDIVARVVRQVPTLTAVVAVPARAGEETGALSSLQLPGCHFLDHCSLRQWSLFTRQRAIRSSLMDSLFVWHDG